MSQKLNAHTTTLRLPVDTWQVIKLVARGRGISANDLVVKLLRDSVEKVGIQREAKAQLGKDVEAVEGLG